MVLSEVVMMMYPAVQQQCPHFHCRFPCRLLLHSPAPPLSHLHSLPTLLWCPSFCLPTLPLVVASDVVLEADVVVEALVTALALEGPLPSVDAQVFSWLGLEWLEAELTGVDILLTVEPLIKMATPGKVSKKERKKQIPAKTSLNSPYSLQWSPLQRDDVHFILDTLKSKLSATGLEKKEVKGFRQWGEKRNKKLPTGHDSVAELPQIPLDTVTPECPVKPTEQGWTDVAARRQLAIGINEVTKALERNQLRLVLVCKSVKPPHMTSHLIALCRTRGVAACQVPCLSESVAGLLGLKCILALGFRQGEGNEDGTFSDTVEAILPRVPALQVAWIQSPPSETEVPLRLRNLMQALSMSLAQAKERAHQKRSSKKAPAMDWSKRNELFSNL
ncbi:unnamed protein product [Coregonus sp. 'balchen']|nr:unnamed protein product [Coregonus sp. 'balchen']